MAQTVIGIFDTVTQAQNAVERLVSNGFIRDRVDLSLHNERSREQVSDEHDDDGLGEKISRFFKNLFDDDDETNRYSTVARHGAAVVTVTADSNDEAEQASSLLDECGAIDVDERSKAYANGIWSGTTTESSINNYSNDDSQVDSQRERDRTLRSDDNETRSIPIMEENLQIDKREVDRGSVRLRSRIVERPVEETVRLREERVNIDRHSVDRPAREGDFDTFKEGEIEIRQRSEVPVVNKEARVVEEININKDVREREETIRDTVRKTEVDIDDNSDSTDDDESLRERRQKKDIGY